jgi:uncharacterized membrane protein
MMPVWLYDIIFPLGRWVHIVSTTLIVGGTLFFELVLPIAIEDLKREQQFFVFARARLVFRWVVWIAVWGLLLSGSLSLFRMWAVYPPQERLAVARWALAHAAVGAVGMIVALLLIMGGRPPENPVRWMRLNLMILLVAIFVGSATRHFQLSMHEREPARGKNPAVHGLPDDEESAKAPATRP